MSDSESDWITVTEKTKCHSKPKTQPVQATDTSDKDDVTLHRRQPVGTRANRSDLRQGQFQTVARNATKTDTRHLAKLDNDHENFTVCKLDRNWMQRIQNARQALGLSQKQLAQKLNLDVNLINQYEKGTVEIPDGRTIDKLNKFLFTHRAKI